MQTALPIAPSIAVTPSRRTRRIVIGLIALTLLLIVLYFGLSLYLYNRISIGERTFTAATPTGAFQDVTFAARGKSYLVHAFDLPGDPTMPALISVHGYNESRHTPYHLKRAEDLRGLGYTVVSLDLSDNGGDTHQNGRISMGDSERWDVLGAYDYLLTRGFAPDRIGLVGESMGAATSLVAAGLEPRIRAVWEDSGYEASTVALDERVAEENAPTFFVPGSELVGWLISGEKLWDTRPIDQGAAFAAAHQAIYIIHDEPDALVFFQNGVDLYNAYKAAGVAVTFWDVPDHAHVEAIIYHHAEYLQRLDAFFKQNLAAVGH